MSLSRRISAALLTVLASGLVVGQTAVAQADEHPGHGSSHHMNYPTVPLTGKMTKTRSVIESYEYQPSSSEEGSSSGSGSSGGSAPAPTPPGPLQTATETAKGTASAAAAGAGSTVSSL